ncbi:hypothetical protein GCM10008932_21070 [Alkalibacterium iburiense]|uniref:VWFA domain-containing protein n=1 Tax=Alkalibacterium iburiense TaxID=290589 RepID=A0ABN0XP32_9LACT
MNNQHKPLHTHIITLLFVLFQFIQFVPSSLVSSLNASAETNNAMTLFSDASGSGKATWSLSEDGKLVTWNVSITQNESETEAASSVEVVLPANVGPPQIVSATPSGVFTPSGNRYRFNSPSSTTAETLHLKFTTSVSDSTSQSLEFKIGASIHAEDETAAASLHSVSIPNKLAQIEAQRLSEEKVEAERLAAEKAEAERIAEEEHLAAEKEVKNTEDKEEKSKTEKLENQSLEDETSQNNSSKEKKEFAEEEIEYSIPSSIEEEKEEKTSDSEREEDVEIEVEAEFVEEEYDPGDMLDGFQATSHPANPTPITHFAPGSLGAAKTPQKNTRALMIQQTTDLQPGEVRTNKTASPVDGMVNTWDIIVRIEGRDAQEVETTDVVLVIDRSGSMADNNRMQNAKSAAINFINTMIPADPYLRIAVVSYSSNHDGAQLITINSQFSNNTQTLRNAVNSLTAAGGTHTQAGIIQGQSLLNGSSADNKFMVLLSDGEPTFSYEPSSWSTGLPSWGTSGGIQANRQQTGIYDGNFNTNTVVGTGSDLTESYTYSVGWLFPTRYRRHVHNGFAAIKAGEDARAGFDGLFTIAVEAGTTGTSILNSISSPGMSYSTDNPEELAEIYERIGAQISTQYALRNVKLTDQMGDGFSLVEGTIHTSEGTTSVESTDTITWTINPAVDKLVEGTEDVRYAELTYRVDINDDILNLDGAKTDEHRLFDTNKITRLTYTDSNNQNKTVNIASPKVDPVLLKVAKRIEGSELDDRQFVVEVSNDAVGYTHSEQLIPNHDYTWVTTLRHEGLYSVEETGITGLGETDLDRFIISYQVDGEDTSTFEVNHIKGIPRGDITVEVTNQEITFIDLTAVKVWEGGPEENKNPVELTLWRTTDGTTLTEVGVNPEVTPAEGPADEFTYTWSELPSRMSDGTDYTYYFTELEVEGYTRVYENYTTISGELYGVFDANYKGMVTNTFQIPRDTIQATKKWVNGKTVRPDLWFQLRRTVEHLEIDEAVDIMKLPAATESVETVSVSFENIEQTDSEGNDYSFYVVEGFYDEDKDEFTPGVPENFVQSGEGLALLNTYIIPQLEISGTKTWINDTAMHRPSVLKIALNRITEEDSLELVAEVDVTPDEDGIWFYDFGEQDKTDSNGNAYVYSITESVPQNYNETYADGYYVDDVLHLDVRNSLVMGDLYIQKTDRDGSPILDNPAEFRLTRIDPEEANPFTMTLSTDAEGKLVFTDLLAGTYLLEETKAPLGFNLYPDDFVVVVEKGENGETIVRVDKILITEEHPLVIRNHPSQSLPDTGSMGTTVFTLLGLALMGGTVYGFKKSKNKKHNQRSE